MNRITLYLSATAANASTDNQIWMARFSGSDQARIMRLFGTAEVPTAYTAEAAPEAVLAAIRRNWPDAIVTLEATQ